MALPFHGGSLPWWLASSEFPLGASMCASALSSAKDSAPTRSIASAMSALASIASSTAESESSRENGGSASRVQ